MFICALYPRFGLLSALGDSGAGPEEARRELVADAVALAPEPGCIQVVGEVSPAAEAFGVVSGMRVGEALARCPELRLVPPDPEGVRAAWSAVLDRLEGIGADCESDAAGVGYFEAGGIVLIHGGLI